MSTSISISKLKSELRQAQRLLSRNDKLNASLRVETERRVESLKSQIHEEQQRRGEQETNGTTTAAPALAPPAQDQDASKQNGTESAGETTKPKSKNKKSAKEDKYKMLRHVEFQKSSRRLKQAERELAAINAKLGALPTDDSKTTRKERKALEKEKTAAESKRDHALIDAWYGVVSILAFSQPLHSQTNLTYVLRICRHFHLTSNTLPCTLLAVTSSSETCQHSQMYQHPQQQRQLWNHIRLARHLLESQTRSAATGEL